MSGIITKIISESKPNANKYVSKMQSGRCSFVTTRYFEIFINLKILVSNAVKNTLSTKATQSEIIIGEIKVNSVLNKPKADEKLKTKATITAEQNTNSKMFRKFFESSFNFNHHFKYKVYFVSKTRKF